MTAKEYYAKNRDRIRKKQREYRATHPEIMKGQKEASAKNALEYYYKNKERCLACMARYKDKNNELHRIRRSKYPSIYRAQNEARKKLRTPPDVCSVCFSQGVSLERHHPDYDRPLEVVWLCRKCHALIHRKYNYADL
jgi:hypothetical protein